MGLTDTPVPLPSGATATTAMRAAAKQTLGAATRAVSPKGEGLRQQIPVIPTVHLPAADDLKAAGQGVVEAVLIFTAAVMTAISKRKAEKETTRRRQSFFRSLGC